MTLSIAVVGRDDPDTFWSLQDWLEHEPALAGRVRAVRSGPKEHELSAVPDHLDVLIGSGGALAALAAALRTWFAQPRRSDIKIIVRDQGGRTIEIDARRVADVKDVESLLRDALDVDGQGGPDAPA